MKKENLAQYVLRLTLTLFLIAGVVAAALAGVNAITKDAIAANQEEKTLQALQNVLPGVAGLEKIPLTGDAGIVSEVYASGSSYAVIVTPGGFGGELTMMVGIVDGTVSGISVISHSETPGLGAKAADVAFYGQFAGKSGELTVTKTGAVSDQDINAITAATITSKAVTGAVNEVLAAAQDLE